MKNSIVASGARRPMSVEGWLHGLGLPADANKAQIRAALAAAARPTPTRAAAPRPVRPKLTATAVAGMSSSDLRAAQSSAISVDERAVVDDEISHRDFVARNFPAMGRGPGTRIFRDNAH